MKVKIRPLKVDFTPVKIELNLETFDELLEFAMRMDLSLRELNSIRDANCHGDWGLSLNCSSLEGITAFRRMLKRYHKVEMTNNG